MEEGRGEGRVSVFGGGVGWVSCQEGKGEDAVVLLWGEKREEVGIDRGGKGGVGGKKKRGGACSGRFFLIRGG